jgi:hypothetical protein
LRTSGASYALNCLQYDYKLSQTIERALVAEPCGINQTKHYYKQDSIDSLRISRPINSWSDIIVLCAASFMTFYLFIDRALYMGKHRIGC